MAEKKNGEEPRKEPAQDYYAGYYWGNNPYTSDELPGRKSDEELRNDIIKSLGNNDKINLNNIEVSVVNATATLRGTVKTYEERRLVGELIWKIPGVVKVLNELNVSEPETAGPRKSD